ncbi:MAG TPA: glycosyltransferase family 4 protein [Steroidobacteraceae bacterium]|jgi:glycosyltransferase involved in cell wall biosynthesis|nr:glycosyltransferase family 4 protein [Steroidobacteraceae bacterium]
MKVLWFSHLVPYPEAGLGVLQRSYHLVRELSRAHDVYLLAFVQRKIIGDLLGDVEKGLERAREHLGEYCARVQFLPIPSDSSPSRRTWLAARSLIGAHPYTIRWLQSDIARKVAADWNASIDFEVVHFDTLSLAPYRGLFARAAKSLDHHNIESDMMLRRAQIEEHPLKRLYFWQEGLRLRRYESRVCPHFDLNITCSSLDTQRLERVAPGVAVTEVPNGVDTEYFHPNGDFEHSRSLVFAGNMSWYPNAAAMLFFADRVWPALKAKLPGVTMDVVGGSPPPRLSALAARDEDFRVHGFVPDVRPYIGRAAAYVCPIMDGGGTKLKILDALAMGKAIVAHPIACEGIDVQDGRDVIFAREPEEFATSIAMLLGNPELRGRLSLNARALAESSYSYSFIGRRLVSAIERCHAFRNRTRVAPATA